MSSPAPHPSEYWKAAPSAKEGDPDPKVLYYEVGVALSAWEGVETMVSTVFSNFMRSPYRVATRVFGTIVSNGGKRAALRAAAEVEFHDARVSDLDKAAWELLVRHYEEASFRRAEIAHGVVAHVEVDICPGYFLMPPWHNTKKTDSPSAVKRHAPFGQHYRYTAKDISQFSDHFAQLYGWGMEFVRGYGAKYPQKP